MHISLTCRYGCRVLLAVHTAILLVCVASLIMKSDNDKLLRTESNVWLLLALPTFLLVLKPVVLCRHC